MRARCIFLMMILMMGAAAMSLRTETAPTSAPATTQPHDIDLENPTLVTLHVKQVLMKEACAALAQQAATPTTIFPTASAKTPFEHVTLNIDKQPYLVALAKLCVAAKASVAQFGHLEGIDVRPLKFGSDARKDVDPAEFETSWLASPLSAHGPAAVLARDIVATEFVDLPNPARKHPPSITIQVVLLTEPQIHVTAMAPFAELTEAVDENGNSLAQKGPYRIQWVEHPAGSYLEFPVVLDTHGPIGHKIARVSGALHVRVVKKVQMVEITNFDAPVDAPEQTIKIAGHDCKITTPKETGQGQRHMILTMTRGDQSAADWEAFSKALDAGGHYWIGDPQGKMIQLWGKNSQPNGDAIKFTLTYGASNGRVPGRLVWDVPLATQEMTIPFEFHDLPLP